MPARDPKTGRFVSGGQNIGNATGSISIDTSGVISAERAVASASKQMTASVQQIQSPLKTIANRFREAEVAAKAFAKSDLGVIQNGLENAARSMTVLSAGAGLLAGLGLRAAGNINLINARFKVMLGSSAAAAKELENIRKQADLTGQPFLELADTASQLLGLTKSYGVEVGKLVTLTQQLNLIDPTAPTAFVSRAIREFLSGNTRSIVQIFEGLEEAPLKAIAKGSEDATTKIALLTEHLNKLGFTTDLLKGLSDEGVFAFAQLKSEVTEALATAFDPLFRSLLSIAQGFGAFVRGLRETNPEVLKIGAGLTVVVAGIAPLLFGLNQLVKAYQLVKIAALAANVSPGDVLKKGLGLGIAVGGGLALGDLGARGLAASGVRTGDLGRVADGEDPLAIVAERLQQGAVLVVKLLIDAAEQLALVIVGGADHIAQAFELLVASVQLVGAQLTIAGADIATGIADLIQSFNPGSAALIRANAEAQRVRGEEAAAPAQRRLDTGFDRDRASGLAEAIRAAAEAARILVVGNLARSIGPPTDTRSNQQLLDDIARQLKELPSLVKKPVNAIQAALEANAAEIQETAGKIKDINDSLAEEQKAIDDNRKIQAARAEFDVKFRRGIEDVNTERSRGVEDVNISRRRNRDIALLGNELVQITAEIEGQRNDLLRQAGEDSIARAEDHQKRLEEIERDTQRAVASGASRLDANAVFEALQSGIDAVDKENTSFDRETAQRKKSLDEQLRDLDKSLLLERDRKVAALREQITLEDQERAIARQQQDEDRAVTRAQEDAERRIREAQQQEDFIREDNARRTNAQKQINNLLSALATTTGIQQAIVQTAVNGFNQTGGLFTQFVNYIRSEGARLLQPFTNTTSRPAAPPGRSVPTPFASGGIAHGWSKLNDGGGFESAFMRDQLMLFTQPTRIFSAQQTQALLGGAGGGGVHIENFAPVFNDVGNANVDDLMGRMRQELQQIIHLAEGG